MIIIRYIYTQLNPKNFNTQSLSGITQVKKGSGLYSLQCPPKQAERKTILRRVKGAANDIFVACVKRKKIFLSKL